MKRLYFSKLIILLVVLSGWSFGANAQCNCNYLYKMPITVNNLGATALTNYQISITVNTQALVSAGKMLASGNDIRFADGTCTNLPYYIESGMNTPTTLIWINVSSIPVAGTSINMFYGNPSATAGSDGNTTFLLFDDFTTPSLDVTKWTFLTNGCVSNTFAGGNMTMSSTCGGSAAIRSNSSFAFPVNSEMKVVSCAGSYPNMAQSNTGSYSNGVNLTSTGGSMVLGGCCPSGSVYAGWCGLYTSAGLGATAGVWSLVRTNSNNIGTWPGGTLSGGTTLASANQQVSLGLIDYSGSGANLVVDWVRVRQYYPAGTSYALGAEITNAVPPITGTLTVCNGATTTLSDAVTGGTWTSGNLPVATVGSSSGVVTGVSLGTANITYTTPGGCTVFTTVTVNPAPGVITGAGPLCQFTTLPLGATAPGGAWSASNFNVTIGTTGIVTGVTAGTSVISYILPGGCFTTATVTVNAAPTAITGTASVCASGSTTALSDGVVGGTWTSSTPTVATVVIGTGLVTGVTAGITNITYTLPTGCFVTVPVTVNPLPAPIGGSTSVCVGATTTLNDATPGGTWTSSNIALASVGLGTGIVTGVLAGVPTITYTLSSSGCKITTAVLVNPLPGAISGSTNVCVGQTTSLSDAGGGSWTSSNTAVATIGPLTGLVSGVAPGSSTITYNLPTGCSTTTTVAVNPLPVPYAVTGGGSYCSAGPGVHVGMFYGSTGVNYQLYLGGVTPVGFPVAGSNSGLDFGAQFSAGVYTVKGTNALTGCTNDMLGSVTITILPLPNVFNVTVENSGGYCAGTPGVHIGLDNSTTGVKYQLYYGATPVGPLVSGSTGTPLDFGVYSAVGTYSVLATITATGCNTWMSGNPTVYINPLPTVYVVSGGGNYCAGGAGVHIFLGGSDGTANYTVKLGGLPVGGAAGTGGPLDFGLFTTPGTYTVVAVDGTGTGCTSNMSGSVTIGINPLPATYTVTGGGGFCIGSPGPHVGLSFSNTGVNYTLVLNGVSNVATVAGSGSGLDFGPQGTAGVYTVVAQNATTLCARNMIGSVTVTPNPLPTVNTVYGGGNYCLGGAGLPVSIDASQVGVRYKLYKGATLVASVMGTGGGFSFGTFTAPGTYTATAVDTTTGCSSNMGGGATIIVNPLPTLHTVTGGGSYCADGTGVDVALNGSNTGIYYDLYNGVSMVTTMSGTGAVLHFGLQTGAGIYTVVARDSITGCTKNMLGSATVTINPLPNLFNMTGGGTLCAGGTGYHIGLDGSNTLINYQLLNGSTPVGAPLPGTGFALDFGVKTAPGVYTVHATNSLTGCNVDMSGFSGIIVNPLPPVQMVSGSGNYCAGGAGRSIGLSFSDTGMLYYLYRGTTLIDSLPGIETPLTFGPDTFGVYTMKAKDTLTGCMSNMSGTATIVAVSPAVYTVTGGGGYCAGGTGVLVGLSGSALGVSYQLINGTPVGLPVNGNGSSLNFGLQIAAGTYTVVATDTTLGCTANMMSSATVTVNPLPLPVTVTGGGQFCHGTPTIHVGINNSYAGINYQLYDGAGPVGTAVSGSGAAIDFGIKPGGVYTVIATNSVTGCSATMTGSATVIDKAIPHAYTDSVGGYYGNYCAADSGVHIFLNGSDTGVYYQLYRGTSMVGGLMAGTGSRLDMGLQVVAGTYTITARDSNSTCTNNMLGTATVNIVPLPTVHNVIGGGTFCSGAAGVHVGLDASDLGIRYSLYRGATLIASMFGTGAPLDFGLQNTPGTYTIVGGSAITPCDNNMFGAAVLAYDTLPLPVISIRAYPGTGIDVWHVDSVRVFVANGGDHPTFQWYVNEHLIPGETTESFTRYELFNKDSVSCQVTASGPCGGLTANKSIIITLHTVGVQQITAATGDVKLIPNPNKGTFSVKGTLATTADEEVSLEVTNMLGQVVYTNKVMTHNGIIDEHVQMNNTLANGMYMLNMRSQSTNTVFHFVVEQ